MIRLTVDAPDLAKALGNALAFMPARSTIPYGLIVIYPDHVYTSGTDGYAAGTDRAEGRDYQGDPGGPAALLVDKEGLTALERFAREAKKDVAVITADSSQVWIEVGESSATCEVFEDERCLSIHERINGYIDDMGERRSRLMIDPSLLSRFGKVKVDKTGRQADLWISDDYRPVFVKMGPTFKGLVMPINREVNSENIGEDGLW